MIVCENVNLQHTYDQDRENNYLWLEYNQNFQMVHKFGLNYVKWHVK
jgi:hypothetical protein